MKRSAFPHLLLLLPALLVGIFAAAQSRDPWVQFEVGDSERYGFRDARGTTRIPAGPFRYEADTFHNIMVVEDSNMRSWYLLKTGKIIGRDSVYYFDNTPDCESEGKIRFQDRKRDKVGFFNGRGKVAIPAVYDFASPFVNGLSMAYRNGRKQCADRDTSNCEHWMWVDGESVLINDRNEVLATGLSNLDLDIDWFSTQRNLKNPDTAQWITIKGVDGNTYSFRHHERDFKHWLSQTFKPSLSSDSDLMQHMYETVVYTHDTDQESHPRSRILSKVSRRAIAALFREDSLQRIDIFRSGWYLLSGDVGEYSKFLTACGDHDQDRYPGFQVVVSYYAPRKERLRPDAPSDPFNERNEMNEQHSLYFIRTEEGYRLMEISL